jgi:hypothetical protein
MAVTAVTITSGPTVVGRSVTLSGTLSRDGGGTNNNLNFLSYTVGYGSLGTITRLSDNSTIYNAAGTAGTDIAWTWTGTLPEGNYLAVTVNLNEDPYTLLATSASNVGLVQLRKPLSGIWTPRRDSRGLFVPKANGVDSPISSTAGFISVRKLHYNYPVSGSNGIYTTVLNKIIRNSEADYGGYNLQSVNTPYGAGINAQTGWTFTSYPTQGGGLSISRQTWISIFYIYNANKRVTNYPRFFGGIGNNPSNRSHTISWNNPNGEQALIANSDTAFGGGEVAVNGVGNGLHCMVVTSITGGSPTGVRVFLDGQLVGTTTAPSTWNGGTFPTTDFYGNSVSQSGENIGNILFNGILYNYVASDSEAEKLSLNPYSYFFRDAPKTSAKTRLFSGVLSLPDPPTEFSSIKAGRLTPSRWSKQPQGKVDIDWNHPIAQGLNRSIVITGAGAQNPVRPKQLVRYTTRANAFAYSTQGVGLDGSSSEGHQVYLDPDSSMAGATKATYFVYGYTKDRYVYGGVGGKPLLEHGSNYIQKTGYAGGQSITYQLTTSNFEYRGYDAINVVSNYSKFSAAMTFTLGGTQYYYHQGKLDGTNTGTTTATLRYDEGYPLPFKLGGYNGLDSQMGLLWTRELSSNELAALHENPWQIFKPNPGRVYFLPSTVTPFKGGRFLPQRWKQQPQHPGSINWNNSVTKGLVWTYAPTINPLYDLVKNNPIAYPNSSSGETPTKFNNSFSGRQIRSSISTSNNPLGITSTFTVAMIGEFNKQTTNNLGVFFQWYYGTFENQFKLASNNANGFRIIVDALTEPYALVSSTGIVNTSNMFGRKFISASTPSAGTGSLDIYVNNTLNVTTTGSNSWTGVTTHPFDSMYLYVDQAGTTFTQAMLMWNRRLSDAERFLMSENPWQIFKPNPGRMYFIPGVTKRGKFLFLFN